MALRTRVSLGKGRSMSTNPHHSDQELPPKRPGAEQDFRRALDSIPQLIWSAFPDGSAEYFNRRWFEYTGLTAEQAQGWGWGATIHPEDVDELEATWRRILVAGVLGEATARMRKADGNYRWFLIRALPMRDEQDRIVRWYGSNTDIDDWKRAEEALRGAEERFRLAAEAGKMFAYEWDAATDLIVRSAESAQILGIDEATPFTGRQVLPKVHEDDRERLLAAMAKLSPDRPYLRISYRMVRPDGAVIWIDRNSCAYFDEQGRMLRIVGMIADITERKRSEQALNLREAELAESQRLAKVGSWRWDLETDTVAWSEELYRIAGIDPKLPAVSYREHSKLYTAESWDRLSKALEEALRSGTPYELDLEMVRSDGTRIWLVARGEAQRDAKGRIVELHGTIQDFSKRKQIEEALRESEERFRLVANSAPVLVWMSGPDKLCTYFNQPWLEFTGRREEELGNGWAEGVHPEDMQKCLETYTEAFDRLALLAVEANGLADITDSPPLIREKSELFFKRASEILSDVQALSHRLHSSKLETLGIAVAMKGFCDEFGEQQRVKISFAHGDVPDSLPQEIAVCLFRILQEGLLNAMRHSGARHFGAQLRGLDGELELTIRDSGIGFDPEAAENNRGLGIVSMRERVGLVNGTMSIVSKPMVGTEIRVRVPVDVSANPASEGIEVGRIRGVSNVEETE
jgi:PAS domain S-box-containing protein